MINFWGLVIILALTVIQAKSLDLTASNRLFSASLYQQVVKNEDKNICFSPFSAEIALALLNVGARSETAEEIRKVLHFPNSTNEIEEAFKNFLSSVTETEELSLHTANKVYIKQNLPLKTDFRIIAQKAFKADLENINFGDKTKAAETINEWVKTQTKNKIQNLIDPNSLRSDTIAILINALYLKARWRHEFAKRITKKVKFYKSSTEVVEVDGMGFFLNRKFFKYGENAEIDAKILEFSFDTRSEGNGMIIILPNDKNGIKKIEQNLDAALATELQGNFVEVMLPKFKVETQLDLKSILQNVSFTAKISTSHKINLSNHK